MEFKEFVLLKEAGDTYEGPTGVRTTKDSGDDYDPDKVSTAFDDNNFNLGKYMGVTSKLAPKFQKFFKNLAKTSKPAQKLIKDLKLDERSGAAGLAALYARILHDALQDGNGNPISLNDETSYHVFKNRLKTQLGEGNSILYPILFLMGRNLLNGDEEAAKNGSIVFLKALSDILGNENIDVDGKNIYHKMKDFDTKYNTYTKRVDAMGDDMTKQLGKEYKRSNINKELDNIMDDLQQKNIDASDLLYMDDDEYMKLYYPDAAKGDNDDSKFAELKKAMFDAIKTAKENGEEPFHRGTETDKVVNEFGEYVLDTKDPKMISDFADAVIAGSKGSRGAIPSEWLSKVAEIDVDLARDIKKRIDTLSKDTYEPEKLTSKNGPGVNVDNLSTFKGTDSSQGQLSSNDIAKFKNDVINTPSTRGKKLRSVFDQLRGKSATKEQYMDLMKFIDSLGRDDVEKKPKGFRPGQWQPELKSALKVEESTSYDKFLTLYESSI